MTSDRSIQISDELTRGPKSLTFNIDYSLVSELRKRRHIGSRFMLNRFTSVKLHPEEKNVEKPMYRYLF